MKNIFYHIKYPYTALIIAIVWISIAIIIVNQMSDYIEEIVIATIITTIIIAYRGFKTPK